jgi:MoaA/NifB/PqqE/SkfB family radical SAM enzyme
VSGEGGAAPFSRAVLDRSLVIFFLNALRTSLGNPAAARSFARTVSWAVRSSRIRRRLAREGLRVPPIIIYSITRRCNLACNGCYSAALGRADGDELAARELHRIVDEAKGLGVAFFVIAGGEPLLRPEFLDAAGRHPGMVFLVFTNGTLIDERLAGRLRGLRNVVPLVSIEGEAAETDGVRGTGAFERVRAAMERLAGAGIFYGSSITLTSSNFETVTGDEYIGGLFRAGTRFFLFLEYTPVQEGTDERVPGEARHALMPRILRRLRRRFPALFIGVPWDEDGVGGCLSAGRGFVHIAPDGRIEPCPFAPFSDTSAAGRPLREALRSPLLDALRADPRFARETGGGCVLWQMREEVAELTGASPRLRGSGDDRWSCR